MKLASLIVSDVQADFEGGNSLDVNWNDMLRRGVENVLDKVRPKTLVRVAPIFGGLTGSLVYYYAPSDILVPNAIYGNDGRPIMAYRPPKAFNDKPWEYDVFTLETTNGVTFIKTRKELASGAYVVSECDAVGTISGTVTPTLDEFHYLTGSASLKATFTDAGLYYGDTFSTALDMSDYLNGVAVVPFYCADVSKISTIKLHLRVDNSNYITLNSSTDSIGDYFKDGYNFARFSIANRVTTGSPDLTAIVSWRLEITATTGETISVSVDRITLQLAQAFFLEYVSNKAFVDGTTNAWQDTCTYTEDYVNFDRDLLGILHYEIAVLVDQGIGYKKQAGNVQVSRFVAQLRDKYQQYYIKFPSQEEPLSYNISPEIDLNSFDMDAPASYLISGQDTANDL